MTTTTVSTVTALESALSSAHAGDSILLAPGTYSGLSISNVNVAGGSVTIASQNSANPAVLTGLQVLTSSDLKFSGLDVIGSSTSVSYYANVSSSSNVSFSNMLFEGPSPTALNDPGGLSLWHSSGISVTNSTFEQLGGTNNSGAAMSIVGDNHDTVTGDTFFNLGCDGIDVDGGTSYINISNNTFTDFFYGAGYHAQAIHVWDGNSTSSANDITISDNISTRGAGLPAQGIFIEDDNNGTTPFLNLTISGNTVVGSLGQGIALGGGSGDPDATTGVLVTGNTVRGYTDISAQLSVANSVNATVTNNSVTWLNYVNGIADSGLTQSGNTILSTITPPSPTLANAGAAATYHGGGAAAAIAPSLSVADYGSTILESASVAITGGFLTGDSLNFANQHGISGSYNAATGILTLTGMATLANYQAALDSITYSSSLADPSKSGTDAARTVTFSTNDGLNSSNALAATVSLGATSQPPPSPPSLTDTGSAGTYHSNSAAAAIAPSLIVADTGTATLVSATVAVSAGFLAGDALGFTNQNGITGSYNAATGVLTLSGTASVAAYQAALESVTYSSSAADPTNGGRDTTRDFSFTVNNGTQSASVDPALSIVAPPPPPPASPPSLSNHGAAVTYMAGGAAADIAHSLAVSDPSASVLDSATVAITSGFRAGDALGFANQNGITGSYNASTGVLTLTGSASVAAYQAALDSVTYSSSAGHPTNFGADPTRTVSFTVNDGSHNSNTATESVGISAATVQLASGVTNYLVNSAAMVLVDGAATGNQVITASATGNDTLNGAGNHDTLIGGGGTDVLNGGAGSAFIIAGTGQTDMSAGAGSSFIFTTMNSSTPANPDVIENLQNSDRIDLHQIDANPSLAGTQAFHLVSAFDGLPGEATLSYDPVHNMTVLSLEVNGSKVPGMVIDIVGNHTGFTNFIW